MTYTFEQQQDLFKSCNSLENRVEYQYNYNITNAPYTTTSTKYYDNNTTLPAIKFANYNDSFGYFKSLTSLIADKCSSSSMYQLKFNTTNTFSELASNLTESTSSYSSEKFCEAMFRRAGIEMSSYVCNDNKEQGFDDYYDVFTSNMKDMYHASVVTGEVAI